MASPYVEKLRAEGRRPIMADEVVHLESLGSLLRELRAEAGINQRTLACLSEVTPVHLGAIELGARRTRRSTLTRIANVLVERQPRLLPVDALVDRMVHCAGPALAPESKWRERSDRRRERRRARGSYDLRCPLCKREMPVTPSDVPTQAS